MSYLANARRWLLPLTAALAVTLFLVACGSSSSSSSSTSSSGASGTSTGASAATGTRTAAFTRDFAKWSTPPTQIPVTTPLPKPAPKGLSIAYITCGLPTCTTISNSVKSAAQTLGWKFTALGSQPTPEAIKAAWGQAVRLHPDAVFASGFPSSVFAPELAELKKMGVGVFNCCAPDKVGNGITFLAVTPTDETVQGHYIAALAAKFAKGTPNVLFVNLPEFATIQTQYPDFVSALEEYAPGAKQVKINIPNSAIGTTSAGTIVSYLRSHPDINYVALSQDALSAGLPAAMKAAGLNIPFSGDGGGPSAARAGRYRPAGGVGRIPDRPGLLHDGRRDDPLEGGSVDAARPGRAEAASVHADHKGQRRQHSHDDRPRSEAEVRTALGRAAVSISS